MSKVFILDKLWNGKILMLGLGCCDAHKVYIYTDRIEYVENLEHLNLYLDGSFIASIPITWL